MKVFCPSLLRYTYHPLGWCILGAEGILSLRPDNHVGIDTDEDAVGGEVYHYVPAAPLLGTFFSLSCVHAGYLQHVSVTLPESPSIGTAAHVTPLATRRLHELHRVSHALGS